jgi:hypothetical protein
MKITREMRWIGAVIIVLTTALALCIWWRCARKNAEDEEVRVFGERLAAWLGAPEPTASERQKVNVLKGEIKSEKINVPYGFVSNFKPIFRPERTLSAAFVEAQCRRDADGAVIATFLSYKADSTIEVNWGGGTVKTVGKRQESSGNLREGPEKDGLMVGFGYRERNKNDPMIDVSIPDKDGSIKYKIIPYDHRGYGGVNGYASMRYPIAVKPKMKGEPDGKSARIISLILVDYEREKLVGEVNIPDELPAGRPYFYLDMQKDILLGADFDMNWVFYVDLRPYMRTYLKRK